MIMINGKKYNFEIGLYNRDGMFCFFIRAICKSTRRFSCINNLNAILSVFEIDVNDPKVADSMWVVPESVVYKFVGDIQQFLSDLSFLNYLERRLDEDRKLGEWENVLPI